MLQSFASPYHRNPFKVFLVTFSLILSWILVYVTGGTSHALPYLFFVPIVLAAWYWSITMSAMVALVAGILCGPLMYLDSPTHTPQPWPNILARIVIFLAFGLGIGYLLDHMKQQKILIQNAGTELIRTLAHTIELRDAYTNGHCHRVSEIAVEIGRKLRLPHQELLYLEWASLIHDIGKVAIPESILNKPGSLTDDEYNIIKQHPELGDWSLREMEFGKHVRDGVLHHHQRWDGRGYPGGLSGTSIPLPGRIISVSDTWDALTSDRSYRRALPRSECIRIMKDGRGTQFYPEILDIFFGIIKEYA